MGMYQNVQEIPTPSAGAALMLCPRALRISGPVAPTASQQHAAKDRPGALTYSKPILVIESGGLKSPALDRRSLPSQARPGRAGGLRTA